MKMNVNGKFSQFQQKILKELVETDKLKKENVKRNPKVTKNTVTYDPKEVEFKEAEAITNPPVPKQVPEVTPEPKTSVKAEEPDVVEDMSNPPAAATNQVMQAPKTEVPNDKLPKDNVMYGDVLILILLKALKMEMDTILLM